MGRSPPDFEGFVGNRRVVRLLKQYVRGVQGSGRALPHVLLVGPPGYGKSTLARSLASSLGTQMHRLNAGARIHPVEVVELLTAVEFADVLLVDEAHQLPSNVQDLLLGALGEDRMIPRLVGTDASKASLSSHETQSVPEFTAVLATDRPGCLIRALRSRVSLELELLAYSVSDLRAIVRSVCEREGLEPTPQAVTLLAEAARGTPRRAVQFVELLGRYDAERFVNEPAVREFLLEHGIDDHGLAPLDRNYVLLLHKQSRPTSVTCLARLLGVDVHYLEDAVEPQLRRDGLVEVSATGRQLTSAGRNVAQDLAADIEATPTEEDDNED
jgi:Holliday junction DNA helicase RuvB